MINQFNYKNHLSKSLQWLWWFKDFTIVEIVELNENTLIVNFKPRFKIIYWILSKYYPNGFPISGYVSFRLVFIASIIGAGYTLRKSKKDGEVIVRDFQIKYDKPIMFKVDSIIPVEIQTEILKETEGFYVYKTIFNIGKSCEHNGNTTLFYCKPDLQNFSYL